MATSNMSTRQSQQRVQQALARVTEAVRAPSEADAPYDLVIAVGELTAPQLADLLRNIAVLVSQRKRRFDRAGGLNVESIYKHLNVAADLLGTQ